jgi:hypothetical protein
MAGRIAVDRICMIDDLDSAVAGYAPQPFDKIAWINRSKPLDIELTPHQLARLRNLYPIDFAIHEALLSESLSTGPMPTTRTAGQELDVSPSAVSSR